MKGWGWYSTKTLQVVPLMPSTPVYVDGMLNDKQPNDPKFNGWFDTK
jgi:hypothetical protein